MLGKTIGEYQIIEFIGETDNAIVYKGFQPSLNRYVAVKMLKPGVARDPAAIAQFQQQANLSRQLQHPNILPVLDSGEAEGMVYQIAQFVETGTLQDRKNEFYNPVLALALVNGLTEGLEYLHSQGYVHGNLKPTNIFIDANRQPLLSDFGMTPPSGASATPYLAPEQVQGGVVDKRADVYALGVILYEVLVGEPPAVGMMASPRAKRPDLSEAVERVILKSVAQNPDMRFQTVREFRNAFDTAVRQPVPAAAPAPAPVPTPTPAVSQSVQVQQPKGTNWLAIILGVIVVGIICVGAFIFVPQLLGGEGTEVAEQPTQPPIQVTVEIPTRERPTREPRPTNPPEQPTQPPEQPTEPPEGGPPGEGGPELPEICSSLGLIPAALVVGNLALRRKRKMFREIRE